MILYNGKIKKSEKEFAEAVLIRDGKIAKLGSNEEILAYKQKDSLAIDLEGRLALPGFNDSHMHLLHVGYNFSQLYLGNTKSIEEVISLCKEYIKENKIEKGEWVQCYGWSDDNWIEKRHINKHDLDRISKDHPIIATRVCAHVASFNSKGFDQLGLDGLVDVEKGEIIFDENGEPTGVVYEMMDRRSRCIPEPSVDEVKEILKKVGKAAAEKGITSVQSDDLESLPGSNFKKVIRAYSELAENDDLPVRVYEQCRLSDKSAYEKFKQAGFYTGFGNDIFRLGPLKTFCDGSLGARTAWLKEDYSDDKGNRGVRSYEDDQELYDLVDQAHNDGMSVAIHCIGDAAADQAISAIERAIEKNPDTKNRHGIVHAQILNEDLIKRIQAANIITYIQPIFIEYDWKIAEDRVGPERLKDSYHFRKLYDRGIVLPLGTDSPVEEFDPMMNIYCLVTGKDYDGEPEGGWHPEKLLNLDEALKCYTKHSAYASFDEERKGVLAPGIFADIAVLETDIFDLPPEKIKDVEVFMTIMGGKIRYSKEDFGQ